MQVQQGDEKSPNVLATKARQAKEKLAMEAHHEVFHDPWCTSPSVKAVVQNRVPSSPTKATTMSYTMAHGVFDEM